MGFPLQQCADNAIHRTAARALDQNPDGRSHIGRQLGSQGRVAFKHLCAFPEGLGSSRTQFTQRIQTLDTCGFGTTP